MPITRSAIDSPTNAGMVMAPFMYRDLSEGEYEHMAKCATDVVQWRADERVFIGDAPALGGDGRRLPAPRVHLRDGTVTLQEREVNHYQRNDAYGDMVRAGVLLSWQILTHIKSRRQPPVFAGAVKGSQLHLFSTIINWFIAHGHPASGVPPVDPGWDIARASMLADNEAVTMLLATLAADRGRRLLLHVRGLPALPRAHRHGPPVRRTRSRTSGSTSCATGRTTTSASR